MVLEAVNIVDEFPSRSAVLIDNTTLWSALRLARLDYDHPDIARDSNLAQALLHHDLLAMASLCESIVLVDQIYVNAEYATDLDLKGFEEIADITKGVVFPTELGALWHDKLTAVDRVSLALGSKEAAVGRFIFGTEYHAPSTAVQEFRSAEAKSHKHEGNLLDDLQHGTAFYLLASVLMTVPYRPSPLRAELVNSVLDQSAELDAVDPVRLANRVLSQSRQRALRELSNDLAKSFDNAVVFNQAPIEVPDLFLAILERSHVPGDPVKVALSLRDTHDADDARHFLAELFHELQAGDTAAAGRLTHALNQVARDVETKLGLIEKARTRLSIALGFPPSISLDLLRRHRPGVRLGYSLALYRSLYTQSLTGRLTPAIERVFLQHLPDSFF